VQPGGGPSEWTNLQPRLAVRGVFFLRQFLDVAFVSGMRCSFLVPYKVVEADESHLYTAIGALNNVGACLLISDAVDFVDQVDPSRDNAEVKTLPMVLNASRGKSSSRKPNARSA
jgi:hypothetical protein